MHEVYSREPIVVSKAEDRVALLLGLMKQKI